MQDFKEIPRRVIEECWNKGKIEVLDQLYHRDYKGHDPLYGTINVDGVKKMISDFRTAFDDLSMRVIETFAEGDRVCTRFTGEGHHRGNFMGVPGSGKAAKVEGIVVARLRDNKIVEEWAHFDALGLLQQIGIVPKLDVSKLKGGKEQARVS
jgi:steroid delta-isomerase-like uncharacterized protein